LVEVVAASFVGPGSHDEDVTCAVGDLVPSWVVVVPCTRGAERWQQVHSGHFGPVRRSDRVRK
jgi:hypothetical protein